ncbi:MAG TPA: branched-chain amino acid ABC transporter permease [Clostridia bacterium]|nr:branched-chain amino acid ABC transporter permease [Clostridia bacterium]
MFFQQLINGITLGSTYALIALGYTMVYGVLKLINFAHGEIYMFGAFVGMIMVTTFRLSIIPAFIISMLLSSLLGMGIEMIAYRPLRKSTRITALISAIGVSIFLQNLGILIMGPATRPFPRSIRSYYVNLGAIKIDILQIIILIVSIILMVALHLLVKNTKVGKAMRATALDKDAAYLMGINVNRIITITFAIGSALGAAAGVLIGLYFNSVSPLMGSMPGLKGFVAAVLGGIGNIPGAMLGGVILGVIETLGAAYISSAYRDAIAFAVLIIILLVKPSGIMGVNVREKV